MRVNKHQQSKEAPTAKGSKLTGKERASSEKNTTTYSSQQSSISNSQAQKVKISKPTINLSINMHGVNSVKTENFNNLV
jgi:hypothetical protein